MTDNPQTTELKPIIHWYQNDWTGIKSDGRWCLNIKGKYEGCVMPQSGGWLAWENNRQGGRFMWPIASTLEEAKGIVLAAKDDLLPKYDPEALKLELVERAAMWEMCNA